ncbi:MAG TPA: phosphatase PAP2 family protein [Bacteroidetes bacterium]|nr:phosphatase PAP2 family protein [Bacteroidota bacterium]
MKRRAILNLVILFFSIGCCKGQDIYQVKWKKEIPYIMTGTITFGTGLYLESQTSIYTLQEINSLDKNAIVSFDRRAAGHNSNTAHKASNYLFYGSAGLPLFFLADKKGRDNIHHIAVLYGETIFITAGLTLLTKYSTRRTRPFVYNSDADNNKKFKTTAKGSFFSGHASITAANTFFTAKIFSDLYPDSKWKPAVWGLAAAIPAATGYLRVKAGKHFPTDVIAGYAVGASVGLLVPHFHLARKGGKTKKGSKKDLSFYGGPDGLYLSCRF